MLSQGCMNIHFPNSHPQFGGNIWYHSMLSLIFWQFALWEIAFHYCLCLHWNFPVGRDGESICLQCRRLRFDPWVGKIPWRRKWQPTPVFLPGKSHGRRSLVDYSPWGCKESDTRGATSLLQLPVRLKISSCFLVIFLIFLLSNLYFFVYFMFVFYWVFHHLFLF